MRTAVAGLTTILNTNRTLFVADLYTFTLIDATILRYTSADINLTVGIARHTCRARIETSKRA